KFDMNLKKVDVARYCWLHHYGGLYADLDIVCHKPHDPLFEEDYKLFFYKSKQAKDNGWKFAGNAWMYAKEPQHPFWLDLIKFCCLFPAKGDPHKNILFHTGPRACGKVLDLYVTFDPKSNIKVVDHTVVGNNGDGDN